jgi:hypothetical protein
LVTASRRELDETKRNALYRQADSIAFVEAPMVFLYFYNELYAVQPWIKHFVPAGDLQRTAVARRHDLDAETMTRFIARRLLLAIPTLFGVLVVRVSPVVCRTRRSGRSDGRRARRQRDDREAARRAPRRRSAAAALRALREPYRGRRPRSLVHHEPSDHPGHRERFPKTLQLAGAAMLLATALGISLAF